VPGATAVQLNVRGPDHQRVETAISIGALDDQLHGLADGRACLQVEYVRLRRLHAKPDFPRTRYFTVPGRRAGSDDHIYLASADVQPGFLLRYSRKRD